MTDQPPPLEQTLRELRETLDRLEDEVAAWEREAAEAIALAERRRHAMRVAPAINTVMAARGLM
jgi:hypothetical protein